MAVERLTQTATLRHALFLQRYGGAQLKPLAKFPGPALSVVARTRGGLIQVMVRRVVPGA